MKLRRRKFLHLAAGVGALQVPQVVYAQGYPTRPVRLVVGFAPGGGNDITARLIGQWLSEHLGQTFVIENRPGAGTNIATEAVVHAAPDGYTILFIAPSAAINATLYEKLNFNFIRDMTPIAGIMRIPDVMVVNPSVPAKTVPEFIAYAKANPGKVNVASPGVGTSVHLSAELFKMMTGVHMVHVPYNGSAPSLTDLIGGQVQVSFATMPASIGFIRSGKAARAGGDHGNAFAGAARRADRGRVRAGLRGEHVVRPVRAKGTPAEVIDRSTRKSTRPLPTPR